MLDGQQTITGNHNVTNTLSGTEFYTHVISTCQQIYDVLVAHCGPHATDALIIQPNDGRNLKDPIYAIFTKDGINIVRSIEFVSPIQKHIQNLVAYVGSRVDAKSHDGTTTAMLFFTSLVMEYYTNINDCLVAGQLPDYRLMKKELHTTFQLLIDGLEEAVVTVDSFAKDKQLTRKEAVRYVAYHQAMLSSKGDTELSDAIVEVVETLPVELYGLFSVSQSKIETDHRFTVTHDDFDFTMNVISNLDDMNHRMGTEYLAESCDLIVSEDDLVRGNPALTLIEDHLTNAHAGNRTCDLVIVTKSMDATLIGMISTYNRSNKYKIIVFPFSTHKPYSSRVTLLSAVAAVASVSSLVEHVIDPTLPYLIQNAKVHYHNRRLFLSNLYQKDGSPYHPSFQDKHRFLPYTLMVADIRTELEGFTSGRRRIETAADSAMYEDYVDIYRRMISSDIRNLQISGMRHDTLADHDVLQDAFGAVLSSLEHGFVFDGYLKLQIALDLEGISSDSEMIVSRTVWNVLKTVHKRDAQTIIKIGLQPVQELSQFADRMDMVAYQVKANHNSYLYYPVDSDPTKRLDETQPVGNGLIPEVTPVLQPADSYRELFKRVEDLLPKLINTSRAIIPNTVNATTT